MVAPEVVTASRGLGRWACSAGWEHFDFPSFKLHSKHEGTAPHLQPIQSQLLATGEGERVQGT